MFFSPQLDLRAYLMHCFRNSFDAVYGASAGAINSTYFLSDQEEGVSIYADDISNKTFCDLSRLVGKGKGGYAIVLFFLCRISLHLSCPLIR